MGLPSLGCSKITTKATLLSVSVCLSVCMCLSVCLTKTLSDLSGLSLFLSQLLQLASLKRKFFLFLLLLLTLH